MKYPVLKLSIIFTIVFLSMMLTAGVALAQDHNLVDGDLLNLSTGLLTHADSTTETLTISAGDIIHIAEDADVTITGSNDELQILCGAGASLSLDEVTINNTIDDYCPITFTGEDNDLILSGISSLTGGANEPAVCVEDNAKLSISGNGSLTANGGAEGAGIGSGLDSECGSITIVEGTIVAYGGNRGAGIGGGKNGSGGYIEILGGTVEAYGGAYAASIGGGENGNGSGSGTDDKILISAGTVTVESYDEAAGIGGGYDANGGVIEITGGTVTATGSPYGAGIGGGCYGSGGSILISGGEVTSISPERGAGIGGGYEAEGGSITISGGTVNATGGKYAAGIGGSEDAGGSIINISGGIVTTTGGEDASGIGGGVNGASGTINISGGKVFAEGNSTYDIGDGSSYSGTSGTLNISSRAVVFLKNDSSIGVTTTTHEKFNDETIANGLAYGYSVPWDDGDSAYAWIAVHEVTYTSGVNGRLGSVDTTESVVDGNTPNDPPSAIANAHYRFAGWSNGSTTSKNLDNFIITEDTVLTAIFKPISVSGVDIDLDTATLVLDDMDETNDTVTLTVEVSPNYAYNTSVAWSSSDEDIATVNPVGVVTAVSGGTATITATTLDGAFTDTCLITVEQSAVVVAMVQTEITVDVGETVDIACVVSPQNATNKSTSWASDNNVVATVTPNGDENATLVASAVGKANITVTTVDGGYESTCKVTVVDPTTHPSTKYASLSGRLLKNSGAGLKDWEIALYSSPSSEITNDNGVFSFNYLQYSQHTMVFTSPVELEFTRYELKFVDSITTGYSVLGDVITLNYTEDTTNIDLEFRMNAEATNIELADVTFIKSEVEPPSEKRGLSIWIIIIVFALFIILPIAVIKVYKKIKSF